MRCVAGRILDVPVNRREARRTRLFALRERGGGLRAARPGLRLSRKSAYCIVTVAAGSAVPGGRLVAPRATPTDAGPMLGISPQRPSL